MRLVPPSWPPTEQRTLAGCFVTLLFVTFTALPSGRVGSNKKSDNIVKLKITCSSRPEGRMLLYVFSDKI